MPAPSSLSGTHKVGELPRLRIQLARWEDSAGWDFRNSSHYQLYRMVWLQMRKRWYCTNKNTQQTWSPGWLGHKVNHGHLTRSTMFTKWIIVTSPGQYIGKIDGGSPAEAAGLQEGDRIVEVALIFWSTRVSIIWLADISIDWYFYSFWKLTISLESLVDQNTAEFNNLFFHCFVWIFEIHFWVKDQFSLLRF